MVEQVVYLHYYTDTADYFINGYDGEDIMHDVVKSSAFPDGTERQNISLTNFKKNEFIKLDFSWEVPDIAKKTLERLFYTKIRIGSNKPSHDL